jgi:TM2 domain-containing membrane protein YozV/DNA-directed RNA polymerase subunit RPC12/RpoP
MTITCPRCGSENRDGVPNCINCGAPLSSIQSREPVNASSYNQQTTFQKPCINCNRLINSNLAICPYCGSSQSLILGTQQHNKLVTGLLAIFLGTFGVHKFYLGQTMQGILYLVFCWTGIPSVVGVIEGIIYISMNDIAFYQKYG